MRILWLATSSVWLLASIATASTPLQHCIINEEKKTDLCFAVSSWTNSTTQTNDLSIHISARFVVGATGWAGVGIGRKMNNALMFVMYPGGHEGRITVSARSTTFHNPPEIAESAPETHVTRTWIGEDGLHNAQIMCYGCESWAGSELNVMSTSQSFIWAMNWKQQTHSDDVHLKLTHHTDKGIVGLNMTSAFSISELVEAQVSTQRISQQPGSEDAEPAPENSVIDDAKDEHPAEKHHKHALFGLVSIHGFLLAFGFFALTFGVLGIRSGAAKSYKIHWVIQTSAGSAIVVGCLMGIWMSFKHGGHFNTYHQWIGLSMLPSIIIQGGLGYLHHLNYLNHGRRTAVSYYHIWIGRSALVIGNLNVGFGLNLGHADSFKWFIWFAGLILQLSVLLPMWFFWARGQTMLEAARGKPAGNNGVEYNSVEQDAFIVDDEMDEFDDEGHDEAVKTVGKDS